MVADKWLLILKQQHNIYILSGQISDIFPSFCIAWLNLDEN